MQNDLTVNYLLGDRGKLEAEIEAFDGSFLLELDCQIEAFLNQYLDNLFPILVFIKWDLLSNKDFVEDALLPFLCEFMQERYSFISPALGIVLV